MLLAAIDKSPCTPAASGAIGTWIAQGFYDEHNTYGGYTGDSVVTLGRVAWADALARQDDVSYVDQLLVEPLLRELRDSVWLPERYTCWNRPSHHPYYHEYPNTIIMVLREAKYGLRIAGNTLAWKPPAGRGPFRLRAGGVEIEKTSDGSLRLHAPKSQCRESACFAAGNGQSLKAFIGKFCAIAVEEQGEEHARRAREKWRETDKGREKNRNSLYVRFILKGNKFNYCHKYFCSAW